MRFNDKRGFTLIEVVVVAGIIAILAGVLVPMIMNQVDEAKISRAQADMKSLQSSIMNFKKDTGCWPNRTADPAIPVNLLYTDTTSGGTPTIVGTGWNTATQQRIINHLRTDDNSVYGAAWKGPYLGSADADPWGNAYVINADQFATAAPLWIVSAGPDGIVQTSAQLELCADKANSLGDDICIRMK